MTLSQFDVGGQRAADAIATLQALEALNLL
jgi:hypothetical protein